MYNIPKKTCEKTTNFPFNKSKLLTKHVITLFNSKQNVNHFLLKESFVQLESQKRNIKNICISNLKLI